MKVAGCRVALYPLQSIIRNAYSERHGCCDVMQ